MSYGLATYNTDGTTRFSIDESILTPVLTTLVYPNSSSSLDIFSFVYDITKLYLTILPVGSTSDVVRTISNAYFTVSSGKTMLVFTPAVGSYAVTSLVVVATKLK